MATTDTKAGFRLPWSSDKSDAGPAADAAAESTLDPAVAEAPSADPATPVEETENPAMIEAAPAAPDHTAAAEPEAPTTPPAEAAPAAEASPAADAAPAPEPPAATAPAAAPTRKPNKFMADLTKAMQVAAESAREESLARLSTDAKGVIEEIHALSATEATELRKKADDDVAGIRDWSKTEIARIREETDERIAHRKDRLEREIEEHAAAIEARIERVQGRVSAFETEMATFFERLLAEEDPTRFAAMAESIPEPPTLDAATGATLPEAPVAEAPVAAAPVAEAPVAEAVAVPVVADEPAAESTDTPIEATVSPDPTWERDPAWDAAPTAETPADATDEVAEAPAVETAEPQSGDLSDLFGQSSAETDPRLVALGQSADLAAAEAEAASFEATDDGSDEPVAEIAEEDIAARLAGLVTTPDGATAETVSTRVVVTGLVSVASIAGFKRHLSRADGVQSVGVSSGPDGEFVFAVGHGTDIALRDVIPTLPGFGATVTAEVDGEVRVSAHDPEAEG